MACRGSNRFPAPSLRPRGCRGRGTRRGRGIGSRDGRAAARVGTSRGLHLETKAPFRRYLESYRSRGLELLKASCPTLVGYPESVVTTWTTNFDAVQRESTAAADVLRFTAFLAPDDIPFKLISRGPLTSEYQSRQTSTVPGKICCGSTTFSGRWSASH